MYEFTNFRLYEYTIRIDVANAPNQNLIHMIWQKGGIPCDDPSSSPSVGPLADRCLAPIGPIEMIVPFLPMVFQFVNICR